MHTNFHENDYLINLTCHKCYLYSRNMFEISHEIHLVDFLVLYIKSLFYQKLKYSYKRISQNLNEINLLIIDN